VGYNDVLWRIIARQMPDNGFNRFFRLFVKCKEVEIFLSEECSSGVVAHYTLLSWFWLHVPEEELPTHGTF
jgi:hypothetical protein